VISNSGEYHRFQYRQRPCSSEINLDSCSIILRNSFNMTIQYISIFIWRSVFKVLSLTGRFEILVYRYHLCFISNYRYILNRYQMQLDECLTPVWPLPTDFPFLGYFSIFFFLLAFFKTIHATTKCKCFLHLNGFVSLKAVSPSFIFSSKSRVL
jgi:hypothetical protein